MLPLEIVNKASMTEQLFVTVSLRRGPGKPSICSAAKRRYSSDAVK